MELKVYSRSSCLLIRILLKILVVRLIVIIIIFLFLLSEYNTIRSSKLLSASRLTVRKRSNATAARHAHGPDWRNWLHPIQNYIVGRKSLMRFVRCVCANELYKISTSNPIQRINRTTSDGGNAVVMIITQH